MKKLLLLPLLFACIQSFAQDVIIKKNGEELKAKVVEITETGIKYKAEDNLDGPVYNIAKTEVFKLKYANGKSDFFGNTETKTEPVKEKKIEPVAVTQISKYDSLMKLSANNKTGAIIGLVTGPLFLVGGAALITVGVIDNSVGSSITKPIYIGCGAVVLAGGIAELALGGVCLTKARKYSEAAKQYKGEAYLHFTGSGVALQF